MVSDCHYQSQVLSTWALCLPRNKDRDVMEGRDMKRPMRSRWKYDHYFEHMPAKDHDNCNVLVATLSGVQSSIVLST